METGTPGSYYLGAGLLSRLALEGKKQTKKKLDTNLESSRPAHNTGGRREKARLQETSPFLPQPYTRREDPGGRGSRPPATGSAGPGARAPGGPTHPRTLRSFPRSLARDPSAQASTRQLGRYLPPKAPAQKHWAGEGGGRGEGRRWRGARPNPREAG